MMLQFIRLTETSGGIALAEEFLGVRVWLKSVCLK
jgi:hypothetical protein